MAYLVKELFFTLQGEGARTGRAAVFLRFAGCNLWNGREVDRASAACTFCDTEFVGTDGPGGGRFESPEALAARARSLFPDGGVPYVVCTGGEPLLQLDEPLVRALHDAGFEVAIETNGTLPAPAGIDWICVSPKAGSALVLRAGHELKLVHPQEGAAPEAFESLAFDHFFLQPMHGLLTKQNTDRVIAHCRAHPRWRLSLQTHKILGIP